MGLSNFLKKHRRKLLALGLAGASAGVGVASNMAFNKYKNKKNSNISASIGNLNNQSHINKSQNLSDGSNNSNFKPSSINASYAQPIIIPTDLINKQIEQYLQQNKAKSSNKFVKLLKNHKGKLITAGVIGTGIAAKHFHDKYIKSKNQHSVSSNSEPFHDQQTMQKDSLHNQTNDNSQSKNGPFVSHAKHKILNITKKYADVRPENIANGVFNIVKHYANGGTTVSGLVKLVGKHILK